MYKKLQNENPQKKKRKLKER